MELTEFYDKEIAHVKDAMRSYQDWYESREFVSIKDMIEKDTADKKALNVIKYLEKRKEMCK